MTTIIQIGLATPKSVPRTVVEESSWLLHASVAFPDRTVLAFGAPGIKKDASLGRLFDNLRPASDGFTIELGAILAERLSLEVGESEAALAVAGTAAVNTTFSVSNAMVRLHYRKGETDRHAVCPIYAVSGFVAENKSEFPVPPHAEYIPSVITARYKITGKDADEALSIHLENVVDDFIRGINKVVSAAIVSIDPSKTNVLVPVYDRGSFPWVYLMIRGEGDNIGAHLVATSLLRTALVSQPLDAERWASFRSILDGAQEADIALVAIRNAQSYIQAGAYDFALLLAAIAAEVATTRYVHARLQEAGVSKKKLKDVERDLTFSVMLSTQLIALSPKDAKPDPDLLRKIDQLRTARNKMMHEGRCRTARLDIVAMVKAADQFIAYIRSLEAVDTTHPST